MWKISNPLPLVGLLSFKKSKLNNRPTLQYTHIVQFLFCPPHQRFGLDTNELLGAMREP
jgi:hypothetical protein